MLSRRTLMISGSAAALAAPLAGCAIPTWLGGTDYLGEAAAAFTAGSVGLTALTTLVKTGVISVATARSWQSKLDAVSAIFATLHGDADNGTGLAQAAIDAAISAWNAFQTATKPAVVAMTPAQATQAHELHRQMMLSHPRGINWAAIISFVISNLSVLTGAGGAIASLIGLLVQEIQAISKGSTTVAMVDNAYNAWLSDLAAYQAAIA